ncbi:MAG: ATP-binding protein [Streptosporangiaceae bacterium]
MHTVTSAVPDTATTRAGRAAVARAFPGRPEAVGEVRAWVAEILAGSPAVADAGLMASELATNAILHSASGLPGGKFTVEASAAGGTARIDIIDEGALPPGAGRSAGLGQGTVIVRELADAFGADGPDRWFTVGTAGRSAPALADAYRAAELEEAVHLGYLRRPGAGAGLQAEAELEAGL